MVRQQGHHAAARKNDARIGQITTLQQRSSEHQTDAGEPHRDRFPRHGVAGRSDEGRDGA